MSFSNATGRFDLNKVIVRKPIQFPDGTIQDTAYTGSGGVPTLEEVLVSGDDAGGESITGVSNLTLDGTGVAKIGTLANRVIPTCPSTSATIMPSCEFKSVRITGNAGSVSGVITLTQNITATTNYAIFASIYYGFTGSGGTNNALGTSNAMNPIVFSNITATTFTYNFTKGTGDNVNIDVQFLIVYQLEGTDYAKTWSP